LTRTLAFPSKGHPHSFQVQPETPGLKVRFFCLTVVSQPRRAAAHTALRRAKHTQAYHQSKRKSAIFQRENTGGSGFLRGEEFTGGGKELKTLG
jgi:hypothetical protein